MYRVLCSFGDSESGIAYTEGDLYPADGLKPSKERIECLSSSNNAFGYSIIEIITKEPEK